MREISVESFAFAPVFSLDSRRRLVNTPLDAPPCPRPPKIADGILHLNSRGKLRKCTCPDAGRLVDVWAALNSSDRTSGSALSPTYERAADASSGLWIVLGAVPVEATVAHLLQHNPDKLNPNDNFTDDYERAVAFRITDFRAKTKIAGPASKKIDSGSGTSKSELAITLYGGG